MSQNEAKRQQNGRTPPKTEPRTLDLGAKQRAVVDQLQRDQGYVAHLKQEIAVVRERIAAGKGKLDLLAELQAEFQAEQVPEPSD